VQSPPQTNTPLALAPFETNDWVALLHGTGGVSGSQISPHCGSTTPLPQWSGLQAPVVVVVVAVVDGRVVVVVVVVLVVTCGHGDTSVRFARIDRAAKHPVWTLPSIIESTAFGAQTFASTCDLWEKNVTGPATWIATSFDVSPTPSGRICAWLFSFTFPTTKILTGSSAMIWARCEMRMLQKTYVPPARCSFASLSMTTSP